MDPTTLNILLMILGAILGGIIAPIINHVLGKWLKRKNRELGIHSAIFFLLLANAAWVMGEIIVQVIDILRDLEAAEYNKLRGWTYVSTLIVYIVAVLGLFAANDQVPSNLADKNLSFFEKPRGPLAMFIIGNILWIFGDSSNPFLCPLRPALYLIKDISVGNSVVWLFH